MQNVVVIEHRRKSKFRAWVLQQSGILLYQNIFDSIASKSSIDLLVLSYDVPLMFLDSKQSISKMMQNHLISWLNSIRATRTMAYGKRRSAYVQRTTLAPD